MSAFYGKPTCNDCDLSVYPTKIKGHEGDKKRICIRKGCKKIFIHPDDYVDLVAALAETIVNLHTL